MIKDSELNPEKEAQKKEEICSCTCVDQTDKLKTANPLVNKKTDEKNSCC
jgi:hypothetical protein